MISNITDGQLIESDPTDIHPDKLMALAYRMARQLEAASGSCQIDWIRNVALTIKVEKMGTYIREKLEGLSIRDLTVLIEVVEKMDRPSKKPKGKAI